VIRELIGISSLMERTKGVEFGETGGYEDKPEQSGPVWL
jgi:hypothetical protein